MIKALGCQARAAALGKDWWGTGRNWIVTSQVCAFIFLAADLVHRYAVDAFTNMGLSHWPSALMSASAAFGPQLPRL